jgi:hypothetical protein
MQADCSQGAMRMRTEHSKDHDEEALTSTVTLVLRQSPNAWTRRKRDLSERAFYAHRVITARAFGGQGLGSELIDWVALRSRHLTRRNESESMSGSLTGPFTGTTRRKDSNPAIPVQTPPACPVPSPKSQYRTQNSRRP